MDRDLRLRRLECCAGFSSAGVPLPLLAEDRCRLHMLDLLLPWSAGCWGYMRDAGEDGTSHRKAWQVREATGGADRPRGRLGRGMWEGYMRIPAGLSRLLFAWVWGRGLAPNPDGTRSAHDGESVARGCEGWVVGLSEVQQHLSGAGTMPFDPEGSGMLREWGPHPGGLSALADLHPPIHVIVGDFSPWLTPDASAWSYRLERLPRTTLHALRPQVAELGRKAGTGLDVGL